MITSPLGVFLYNWQALIAGGLGLLAGFLAFVGALSQVKAARQAVDRQIAAIQSQLDDARAARQEDEERQREIERAYVSGGGVRAFERVPQAPGSAFPSVLVSSDFFELHINNHGKTLLACIR